MAKEGNLHKKLVEYVQNVHAMEQNIAAIAVAQAKGIADLWRADKAARSPRDAFVTEHLETQPTRYSSALPYAGDSETTEVARVNRAEEKAMAQRIASN